MTGESAKTAVVRKKTAKNNPTAASSFGEALHHLTTHSGELLAAPGQLLAAVQEAAVPRNFRYVWMTRWRCGSTLATGRSEASNSGKP